MYQVLPENAMHIDEMIGVATVAAAAMFAAIALRPTISGAVSVDPHVATAAAAPAAAPIVHLPPIEVVARRSVEIARIEREERFARPPRARYSARPGA
jgi:hypothetical protein